MAEDATAQERLFALRETIARLEGKALPAMAAARQADAAVAAEGAAAGSSNRFCFGVQEVDCLLDGGLPRDGLTEVRTQLFRDSGAATALLLALTSRLIGSPGKDEKATGEPVLWIGDTACVQEAGLPYALGLREFGLRPDQLLFALPRKLEDALWIAELALASRALAATILEVRGNLPGFGLTESRRLALRAKAAGRPLFVLRHAGEEEASSAAFRFRAEPAPALERRLPDGSMLGGSLGHPVFRLTLEKSRNPAPLSFTLEWNSRDRQFLLARPPALPVSVTPGTAHPVDRPPAPVDRPDRPAQVGSLLAFDRAS
ncbi:MAG: hypothetical protein V7774_14100 [Pseudorhizobium pelagicum]|uniref:ImuA family protein n=1 Tax=Pseudorhizobium pelagicum TaxID=1509405 RepID=UPI00345FFCD1